MGAEEARAVVEPSRGVDWRGLLEGATLDAQRAVSTVASSEERSASVGVGASGDLTLLADKKAEEAILGPLSQVLGIRIISEEAGEVGPRDSARVAIVDPLDGSSNFQRGVPFYCSSVGVVEGKTLSSLGHALVRNLVTGDVYFAEKGRGASKNGRSILTSRTKSLGAAVAGIDISRAPASVVRSLAGLVSSVGRQVHLGANALELCLLAEGVMDVIVDVRGHARLVDVAGGFLIAAEAGAVVTDPRGSPLDPRLSSDSRFSFVASANRELHELVLRELELSREP